MRDIGGVLGGNDHVLNGHRAVVLVTDRYLRFRIRAEPVNFAALAYLGELSTEAVGKHHRGRHELGRLIASVAEHQALVTGTLLRRFLALGLLRVDTLGDIRRLRGKVVVDKNRVGVKHIVLVHVANLTDGGAHDGLVIKLGLRGDFTGENYHVGFDHGLAGHPAVAILRQAGIQHAVGNQVSDFVRVPFTDGLGGENKRFCHKPLPNSAPSGRASRLSTYTD